MNTYQGPINQFTGDGHAPVGSSSWMARAGGIFATWSERHRRRQELQDVLYMPDHLLRDMGINREEAYREYRKPFWRG